MKKDFMTIIYIDMVSLQNVSAYEELDYQKWTQIYSNGCSYKVSH